MHVAVVGKGGAGKSVIAGTMARILARRGKQVLALDSDLMPGLALSLGASPPPEPPLLAAVEKDEHGRWRLKKGIGAVRAVERYATPAPDGIRLLECGKLGPEGLPPIMAAVQAYYKLIHRLPRTERFRDWAIVGDLPAGPRQTAFDWAPYARLFVVVVEPTWKSALTARRTARIARARRHAAALAVGSKVTGEDDVRLIERVLGEPLFATIPADQAVPIADRAGAALIESAPGSPAVRAIEHLIDAVGDH